MYDYALNVIYSLINGITETSVKKYEKNVIKIILNDIVPIDFDLSLERKKQMFNIGYTAVHTYMSKQ
jgi:hypothetical protein